MELSLHYLHIISQEQEWNLLASLFTLQSTRHNTKYDVHPRAYGSAKTAEGLSGRVAYLKTHIYAEKHSCHE